MSSLIGSVARTYFSFAIVGVEKAIIPPVRQGSDKGTSSVIGWPMARCLGRVPTNSVPIARGFRHVGYRLHFWNNAHAKNANNAPHYVCAYTWSTGQPPKAILYNRRAFGPPSLLFLCAAHSSPCSFSFRLVVRGESLPLKEQVNAVTWMQIELTTWNMQQT